MLRLLSPARATAILILLTCGIQTGASAEARWYKGNLHAHSDESDGDSRPEKVVEWYRKHGYHFVVITDHNKVTTVRKQSSRPGEFLVIPGEEITLLRGKVPVHITAINPSRRVIPQKGRSVVEILRNNVRAILDAGGIAQISHPNRDWAITGDDLLAVEGWKLVEIYNGNPRANNEGDSQHASLEELWDRILASGRKAYGVAVDDAHHFRAPRAPRYMPPGRAWVKVRANELSVESIVAALEAGDFYSSTGVDLSGLEVTDELIRLTIQPVKSRSYRTQFIGPGGELLQEAEGFEATYAFARPPQYVRVRISDSEGATAWLQPVFPLGSQDDESAVSGR